MPTAVGLEHCCTAFGERSRVVGDRRVGAGERAETVAVEIFLVPGVLRMSDCPSTTDSDCLHSRSWSNFTVAGKAERTSKVGILLVKIINHLSIWSRN